MTADAIEAGSGIETSKRERRGVAEMIGETLREAAVLFGVFMPLDLALQGHPLTFGWANAIVFLPTSLLASGVALERRRR
jgi:hypothetical protein